MTDDLKDLHYNTILLSRKEKWAVVGIVLLSVLSWGVIALAMYGLYRLLGG
jgi:hypothetical protein